MNSKIKFFLFALIASFVLFGTTIGGDFTLDDHSIVETRPELKNILNMPRLWLMPWHPNGEFAGNYRPLTLASYAINYLFSNHPAGFHILNIIIHAANVTLVYYLVLRFASRRVALLSAGLFLFLPIHVEPIASIAGRNGLLGMVFILVALILLFDRRYFWSAIAFLAALFSTDSAIGFLPLAGLMLTIEKKDFWLACKTGLWFVPSTILYFFFRYLALGKYAFGNFGFIDPIIVPLAFVSAKERVLTAFVHVFLYIRKTILPYDLSPDYSFNQIPIIHGWFDSWEAWVGIAVFLGALYLLWRGERTLKIAILLWLVPMLVISNLIFISSGTMAERWWYMPSLGLVVLAALGIDALLLRLPSLRKPLIIAGATTAVVFAGVIIHQNRAWANDTVLFRTAVARSPQSAWARTSLAAQYVAEKRFDLAREELKISLDIAPKNPLALFLAGKLAWHEKRFAESEVLFLQAIVEDTQDRNKRSFYRVLALLNLDQGKNRESLEYMEQALAFEPRGDTETVFRIDEALLTLVKKYQGRNSRTYTQTEINEIGSMIIMLRQF